MKNIFLTISVLIICIFSGCGNAINSPQLVALPLSDVAKRISDHENRKMPLTIQEISNDKKNIVDIVIDSLVYIEEDVYGASKGYFVTTIKYNKTESTPFLDEYTILSEKKVYIPVSNIKQNDKYISWSTDWEVMDNIDF